LRQGSSKIAENVEKNCFEEAKECKFKLGFIGLVRFFLFTYVVMYDTAIYKINKMQRTTLLKFLF